jgi:multidrug efflux pump subunit AcrA (membrane-fusion protein)
MFVDVGFEGRTLQDVAIVPRRAVRQDQTVWVANGERLEVRPVEIHHMDIDSAYISDGLQPGDEVIVTSLDVVADGMHVRVRPMGETDQTAEAPPTIAPAAFTSGDGRQPQ